ncbi:MAG: pyruvate kinase [Oscillospiraceae bacterium]|nr:pyruvate kinase [Oscillospiraceae bacterium]
MRKTKIVCTIGPASETKEILRELMKTGMNVARINFSHGSYEEQEERINNIKEVREELNLPVALLMDTKGPEIRIGKIDNNCTTLVNGQEFTLVNEDILGDCEKVSITYKELYKEVEVGSKILINDGIIELKVKQIIDQDIVCQVINGGQISNRKSMNVPGIKLHLPSLTENDISDIKYCVKAGFDFIAASFIRRAQDVLDIRKVLKEDGGEGLKIISKIENREGIDNFDEILEVSDGIMIARGDLGVEIPMYEVPILQKKFIHKCNMAGKPVITATQMLESMVNNGRPTRAEVSDVANAIFDMTSAVMLSAESATGKYPVECLRTMAQIAGQTEECINYWNMFIERTYKIRKEDYENNIARSICLTAMTSDAKAIFAYTHTGNSCKKLSGFLPGCPIYAVVENPQTHRQLGLSWGVYPKLYGEHKSIDQLVLDSITDLKNKNKVKKGDIIVISGGSEILHADGTFEVNKTIGGILKV